MELGRFKRIDFEAEDTMPDWLRDDEPSTAVQHAPAAHSKNTSQVKSTEGFSQSQVKYSLPKMTQLPQRDLPSVPTVSIHIRMPELHMPRIPFAQLRPWIIGFIILSLGIFGGNVLLKASQKKAPEQKVPTVIQAELGFKPLQSVQAQEGKPTATVPKFEERKKLYTFYDTYKGANLTVDQQTIPEKLKTSKTAVRDLASSIGANETFTTSLGTAYISNAKDANTQRMMLVNEKMLMFIQSTKILSSSDWVNYIQALE